MLLSTSVRPALDFLGRLDDINLEKATVLNLGAGKCASPISEQVLRLVCQELVNVEIFGPYATILRTLNYQARNVTVVECDILKWIAEQPNGCADVVLTIDVIEHITRTQVIWLAGQVRRILRRPGRWLIWVPLGKCPQEEYDGNSYQKHLSTWTEDEFLSWTADVEVYPEFHHHFNPPVDAAWVTVNYA